jgi:hypothetical protein
MKIFYLSGIWIKRNPPRGLIKGIMYGVFKDVLPGVLIQLWQEIPI